MKILINHYRLATGAEGNNIFLVKGWRRKRIYQIVDNNAVIRLKVLEGEVPK